MPPTGTVGIYLKHNQYNTIQLILAKRTTNPTANATFRAASLCLLSPPRFICSINSINSMDSMDSPDTIKNFIDLIDFVDFAKSTQFIDSANFYKTFGIRSIREAYSKNILFLIAAANARLNDFSPTTSSSGCASSSALSLIHI
jgi:hypothetical protein